MDPVDRICLGLIRSFNAARIREDDTDRTLLSEWGPAARPLAEALHEVIRNEIRDLREAAQDGVSYTP